MSHKAMDHKACAAQDEQRESARLPTDAPERGSEPASTDSAMQN